MNQLAASAVVGLGNPGPEYARTRHNVGWMVLDRWLSRLPSLPREPRHEADSLVWQGRWGGRPLTLVKPLTFMNLSGRAVGLLSRRRDWQASDLLVVYDDLDLPLGRLRLRQRGSSGGHRGVESVIQELGTDDFPRLRLGIGRGDRRDAVDHVLSGFDADEQPLLEQVLDLAVDCVVAVRRQGLEAAMSRFNGQRLDNDNAEEPEA